MPSYIVSILYIHAITQQRDEQEFHLKTIGHCDPWFNNMMFKYNKDGKPNGIILIDFQIPSYASPMLDEWIDGGVFG